MQETKYNFIQKCFVGIIGKLGHTPQKEFDFVSFLFSFIQIKFCSVPSNDVWILVQ